MGRLRIPSILIVEDDLLASELLSCILSSLAETVYVANDGEQGLAVFQMHRPSLIITDLHMPVMTGKEMIQKIRQYDSEVPIVVISAYADTSNVVEQASATMTKPVRKEAIQEVVRQLFPCPSYKA
ncbi:response regulator receiver [Desulfurispirillum indicum S5]|uniref:Response regulator receiver n=1 Tax=Desulfurispirillum indicum (strain ATCC BAA-1389 / DSM 22839 / S5) TaxID=653733 RepID=E6W1B2_DESIS|nr:response regulator [Desulfurispirillum indicum]ADU66532.1 response regulator receiver [Desulfurispirillum indicum S5]